MSSLVNKCACTLRMRLLIVVCVLLPALALVVPTGAQPPGGNGTVTTTITAPVTACYGWGSSLLCSSGNLKVTIKATPMLELGVASLEVKFTAQVNGDAGKISGTFTVNKTVPLNAPATAGSFMNYSNGCPGGTASGMIEFIINTDGTATFSNVSVHINCPCALC